MKNILVPTDFSTCASYAMELGIELADFFGATLHFFTCMENSKIDQQLTCPMMEETTANRTYLANANVLFQSWKTEAAVRNIKIKSVCCPGNLVTSIQEYAATHHIDFVVMGSHGASGLNSFSIGSNAQKLIRALHLPIFILKKPIREYKFKNVVYASSFEKGNEKSYRYFLSFIEKFNPEVIHLLGVNTSNWETPAVVKMEEAMNRFGEQFPFHNYKKHLYKDEVVELGIRHFAEEVEADLVVISNHHRYPTNRIFAGSTVEALVQSCELPVLSIDFS